MTNFDMSRYDVKSIANSTLPIGSLSNNKNKNSSNDSVSENKSHQNDEGSSATNSSAGTLSFAIPIKQNPNSDYCSIIGFDNNNSLLVNSTTSIVLPSSSINMDFSTAPTSNNATFFSTGGHGGMFVHQQQNGTSSSSSSSSSIPFATPIFSLNSNSNNNTSYGNWIGHSTFQTHAKPTLFQTPLFGME